MKIAFAGGGTGGHFYPMIAIAEAINDIVREEHLLPPDLYYLAPSKFDEKALFENNINYLYIPAGKVRRYNSLQNLTDAFTTFTGIVLATFALFRIYPDVVFSKGGYASVPVVLAARLLRIPVVIHESDSKPGRANLLAAPFAAKIAIAFDSAAAYFPKKTQEKIARTGIPIRKALTHVEPEGARQYLNLDPQVPTVFILGGSQGAVRINETVLDALPELVKVGNIIHQTGPANEKNVEAVATVVLRDNPNASRYHPMGYLDQVALERAAGIADVVVSRAGATSLAEIGLWQKPSIIIPIPEAISHDQRLNAYAYAQTGAAVVVEEENLSPHILVAEITRILGDKALAERMSGAAKGFTDPDAGRILARELLDIGLSHES